MVLLFRVGIRRRGFLARWERMGIEEKFEVENEPETSKLFKRIVIHFYPTSLVASFHLLPYTLYNSLSYPILSELRELPTMFSFCFHTLSKDSGLDGAVRLPYMFYSFFWVIIWLLNIMCRRFGIIFSTFIIGVRKKNSSCLHQRLRWKRVV
jgi:hypothetical protein